MTIIVGDPSYYRTTEPLGPTNAAEWDRFVDESDEHWLWSRSEWARYQEAYGCVVPWPGRLHRDGLGRVVDVEPSWPRNDEGSNLIVRLENQRVMWSRLSKGHRADVKRGERLLGLLAGMDGNLFDRYRRLHALAFGIVRSPETFMIMEEIARAGRAFVLVATHEGMDVGAAVFFTYKNKAYYGSAPRRPGAGGLPVGHFLVWSAMTRLAGEGYTQLDMGPPTEHRPSIDAFKKHFGAEFPPEVEGFPGYGGMQWR